MGLQTDRLVLVGQGVAAPLAGDGLFLWRGVHLRWVFPAEVGFPLHGYYLLARPSLGQETSSVIRFSDHHPGEGIPSPYIVGLGRLVSDRDLLFTHRFSSESAVELDLRSRQFLRYELPAGDPACFVRIVLRFDNPAGGDTLTISAYDGPFVVEERTIPAAAGRVEVLFDLDRMTAINISGGAAGIVNIGVILVSSNARHGWQLVDVAAHQPISLPVFSSDCPCPGAPATEQEALDLVRSRLGGNADNPPTDEQLRKLFVTLQRLVAREPAGVPMHERTEEWSADMLPDGGPRVTAPGVHTLDTLLLLALNPAFAAILGLYAAHLPNVVEGPFDYLVIADHRGDVHGNVSDWIEANGFDAVDAWIAFRLSPDRADPVEIPEGVHAYAVPAAPMNDARGNRIQVSSSAGLTWLRRTDGPLLVRGRNVRFHLWRAFPQEEPSSAPADAVYQELNSGRAIVPARSTQPPPVVPVGWPPFPLDVLDTVTEDGWYSYQVQGVDIFGRIVERISPAAWYEWEPEQLRHRFGIPLLDRVPPPPPINVWAWVVDPRDALLVRDEGWQAWQADLRHSGATEEELAQRLALRVRWSWTKELAPQAPDLREFSVYFHRGTELPGGSDDAASWQDRVFVVEVPASPHAYEYFLDLPPNFVPDTAHPVLYGWVGVTAADDKRYIADARHPPSPDRYGNESAIGVPVKVVRVKRVRPPAPVAVPDEERVYASAADYAGSSYYSYRWIPAENLKAHIFRALDESVFLIDWRSQPRDPLLLIFPDDPAHWNEEKKQRVRDEIAQLDSFDRGEEGRARAFAYYRRLSDDALRVLASQSDVSAAFTRLTIDPIGGDAYRNRRGPDTPEWFPLNAMLSVYIDRLDGRSRNRYFYRCAYVDGAHNQSELGPASGPVYLPDVIPPLAPTVTAAMGGERSVILVWASNQEEDLAEYRVYRAETSEHARDLRLMKRLVSIAAVAEPSARGPEVEWIDVTAAAQEYWYRVTAVDIAGNESANAPVIAARAFREVPPAAPEWRSAARRDDGIELTWRTDEPLEILVQRREAGKLAWRSIAVWLPLGSTRYRDTTAGPERLAYKLVARDAASRMSEASEVFTVPETT